MNRMSHYIIMRKMWGLLNPGSQSKDKPVNFSSLGVGAHRTNIRNRVSRDVFTFNRGDNFVPGTATPGMEPVIKDIDSKIINSLILSHPNDTIFTFKLNKQPINKTKVALKSNDTSQATINISEFIFDSTNWNTEQTVNVTPLSNNTINTSVSVDVLFGGLSKTITITDEIRDLLFDLTALPTSIQQGTDGTTFTVRLTEMPNEAPGVSYNLSVNDSNTIDNISPASVTFTQGNYNTPQTITIDTSDNLIADGDVNGIITLTPVAGGSSEYVSNGPRTINVPITNPNIAGFTITDENSTQVIDQNTTHNISIQLDSKPSSPVTITATSSNTDKFAIGNSITLNSTNYANNNNNIQITAVNDLTADGNVNVPISFSVTTSASEYINKQIETRPPYTHVDSDTAGITVSASPTTVVENAQTSAISINLTSKPTSPVTVTATDSSGKFTFSGTVTFTETDYDIVQTITATSVDDSIDAGDVNVTITLAASGSATEYSGVTQTVEITSQEDDVAGITVTPTSPTTVTEGNATTITVKLDSEPTADVVIVPPTNVTSKFSFAPSSLTFTSSNYATPQSFTVIAVQDFIDTGDETIDISFASLTTTDGKYNFSTDLSGTVTLKHEDIDEAGITVINIPTQINEGSQGILRYQLDSKPTDPVTITPAGYISGISSNKFTFSPTSTVIAVDDWNKSQIITITATDDSAVENFSIDISLTVTSTNDTKYSGMQKDAGTINYLNVTDARGLILTPTDVPTLVNEADGLPGQAITVKLASEPTSPVTVTFEQDNSGVFNYDKAILTFEPNDDNGLIWSDTQTITADPSLNDTFIGTTTVVIEFKPNGGGYTSSENNTVTLQYVEEETVGFDISTTPITTDVIEGNAIDIQIKLLSEPLNDVIVNLQQDVGGYFDYNLTSLTFERNNDNSLVWSAPQTITATAINDDIIKPDQDVILTFTSTSTGYEVTSSLTLTYKNDNTDVIRCLPSPTTITAVGGKYIFNDETYDEFTKYGLTTGTYTFVNDLSNHPLALLNVGNTNNITYTPEDNTNNPIIIKVSGGNTVADSTTGDFYTFTDASNNPISIRGNNGDNGSFKFMRGVTYRFSDNGVSSSHPFKIFYNDSNGLTHAELPSGGSIDVPILSTQSVVAGDLYYVCENHSGMSGNLGLLYKDLTNVNPAATAPGQYDFFYGNITVQVSNAFESNNLSGNTNEISVYCFYHGYMGGTQKLVYNASCPAP